MKVYILATLASNFKLEFLTELNSAFNSNSIQK